MWKKYLDLKQTLCHVCIAVCIPAGEIHNLFLLVTTVT